jgi:hypothetical protein
MAMEDRLQFDPTSGEEEEKARAVSTILGSVIRYLPETPYSGIGLNFTWNFAPSLTMHEATKRLFFLQNSPISRNFDTGDARYGAYYSKDVLGFRLKLTALPKLVPDMRDGQPVLSECIQFAFNFHSESTSVDDLVAKLGQWLATKDVALGMIQAVERELCQG